MNRARRMLALQGRRIARDGALFLLPDLYGTGDSAGEFVEADLDVWRQDVRFAVDWLYARGIEDIRVLAVRFGSLLLDAFLGNATNRQLRIALWNPVSSGSSLLNQFFRMKIAASMRSGEKPSVADLRARLASEGRLEVAGYFFSARMVESIDAASLTQLHTDRPLDVLWTQTGPVAPESPVAKVDDLLSSWRHNNAKTTYRGVKGAQFWMSPEIEVVPELLDITANFLRDAA